MFCGLTAIGRFRAPFLDRKGRAMTQVSANAEEIRTSKKLDEPQKTSINIDRHRAPSPPFGAFASWIAAPASNKFAGYSAQRHRYCP